MKMMEKSWNECLSCKDWDRNQSHLLRQSFRRGCCEVGPDRHIEREARANPQHGCDRAVRHFASGFVDRDVIDTEDNSSRTGRSL